MAASLPSHLKKPKKKEVDKIHEPAVYETISPWQCRAMIAGGWKAKNPNVQKALQRLSGPQCWGTSTGRAWQHPWVGIMELRYWGTKAASVLSTKYQRELSLSWMPEICRVPDNIHFFFCNQPIQIQKLPCLEVEPLRGHKHWHSHKARNRAYF